MAFPYPIAMPAMPPGPKQIQLAQNFIVAKNASPFTAQQQIYEHQGSWWTGKVDMPFLTRAQAAPWLAFFAALNGKSGTFIFGDPTIAGPLANPTGNPFVSGGGQTGKTLAISSLAGGTIKAGDYFQLGGENRLLYSQAFDNAAWVYTNCTRPSPDTIVAPDGTTTAELLAYTASGTGAYVTQSIANLAAGQTYTFSCWLKAPAGTPTLNLLVEDAIGGVNILVNSQFTMSGSWQRFSVAFTAITGNCAVFLYNPSAITNYHAWGAQVELGTWPAIPGYYPTTSSPFQSIRRLYMNLGDVPGNGAPGNALSIFPRLRESPIVDSLGTPVLQFAKPQGLFRLDSNVQPFTVDTAGHYSISFGVEEAF